MNQFCVLLQSLFTYVWFVSIVWKYFIHILLTYLQAAVRIFLHHAVLLICYWCTREFVGLAWMVRWEKFTHKTYDLKVSWNNQWYWMKYCCMSDVYLHDCTSRPHPLHLRSRVFLCFHEVDSFHSQILVFCRWSQCLLWKNTNLGEQEHIAGPAMFKQQGNTSRMKSMQFLCHTILHSSKGC